MQPERSPDADEPQAYSPGEEAPARRGRRVILIYARLRLAARPLPMIAWAPYPRFAACGARLEAALASPSRCRSAGSRRPEPPVLRGSPEAATDVGRAVRPVPPAA